ncbi:MAG: hypothetical protein PVJ25_05690 [Desulfuromonadales bacterium]
MYEHVPADQVSHLKNQVQERLKKDASLKKFIERSRYLEKLLKV